MNRLEEWYAPGQSRNFMTPENDLFAWAAKGNLVSSRQPDGFHVSGEAVEQVGLALVPRQTNGISLSNGRLVIRYRSRRSIPRATLVFKPVGRTPPILNQAELNFQATNGGEQGITLILPATPGLADTKELVLSWVEKGNPAREDFTLVSIQFEAFNTAIEYP